MADVTYTVKAPDGNIVTLRGPEGASQDEVVAQAQKLYQPKESKADKRNSSILDKLAEIDKKAQAEQPEASPYQGLNYVGQQYKKGVAATLGLPVDATTNLMNLGIAGYGLARGLITGDPGASPEPITNPFGGAGTMEKLLMVDNNVQPTGPVNAVVGRFARDLGGASLPVAGMAGRPQAFLPRNATLPMQMRAQAANPLPVIAAGTGLQVAASTGGELGRRMAPEPYKDIADLTGQAIGGVVAPALVASRMDAINKLVKAGDRENVNRIASNYVEDQIKKDVRNYPGAGDRLKDALALQEEVPGFQPRIGQASGVPSLIDMERRVAVSGPEQFNRRALQDEANRAAILSQAEKDLPLLQGGNADIRQRLQAVQDERSALAENLPQTAADETGRALRDIRGSLKGRYDQLAAEKFQAPVEEANRLGVKIDPSQLVERANNILSDPILQFDPSNAPNVVRRLSALNQKVPGELQIPENGQHTRPLVTQKIGFEDLKALKEAVNQDIARERTLTSPVARQRMRALVEVSNEIDQTAQQAPEQVRNLWNSARNWYREEYAPKFLRGINLKQTTRDITGELRIPDESLAGQYFKKMASTPTDRFVTLYGDSPQAMKAMESHVLDTYRREVVKDGVIDAKKHDIFIRNYGPALKQLPDVQKGISSIGNAAKLLGEREAQLTDAESILSKAQLDRLKYDGGGPNDAIDPAKVSNFLARNRQDFREKIAAAYDEKTAQAHIQNLEKIAKAAQIADRGRLGPNAAPEQSTNPGDLRKSFGFTGRTVFNMIRAVTTGRTSSEDMAFTLGAQAASHRIGRALIAAEERAIDSPETAKLIADSLTQPSNSEAGKLTMRKILQKGGLYLADTWTGANSYERMNKYRAVPFAADATSKAEQKTRQAK